MATPPNRPLARWPGGAMTCQPARCAMASKPGRLCPPTDVSASRPSPAPAMRACSRKAEARSVQVAMLVAQQRSAGPELRKGRGAAA
eukprot:8172574-Alexandrium_andersonii.AAC.1